MISSYKGEQLFLESVNRLKHNSEKKKRVEQELLERVKSLFENEEEFELSFKNMRVMIWEKYGFVADNDFVILFLEEFLNGNNSRVSHRSQRLF